LCVKPPLVAVMVRVDVPVGALWLALTVNVDEPDPVIEPGLKLALVRRGNPLTLRLTAPVNPLPAVTLTLYKPLEPCDTLRLAGVTLTEKSPLTTSVTFAV
jgi:hypothetical protein